MAVAPLTPGRRHRDRSLLRRITRSRAARELFARAAKTPLALKVPGKGRIEGGTVEIRPQELGEIELRIGKLPDQEVADALLAAGADEEIWLRRIAHGEMRRQLRLAVPAGTARSRARHGVDRLKEIPSSAVVRRDGEGELAIAGGACLGAPDEPLDGLAEGRDMPDHTQTDPGLVELLDFLLERHAKQLLQHRDFLFGPAPVLRAERKQGEVLDAALCARAHHRAHRFDAATMAGNARQEALFRPTPVAIHDDGNVPRHDARVGDGLGGAYEHSQWVGRGGARPA